MPVCVSIVECGTLCGRCGGSIGSFCFGLECFLELLFDLQLLGICEINCLHSSVCEWEILVSTGCNGRCLEEPGSQVVSQG